MDEIKWINVKKRLPEKDGVYVVLEGYPTPNGYFCSDIELLEFYHDLADPDTGYDPETAMYRKHGATQDYTKAKNIWVRSEYVFDTDDPRTNFLAPMLLLTDVTDIAKYWMPIDVLANAPMEE